MKYSPVQYAEALYESLRDGEEKVVLKNFSALLARHTMLKKVPAIIDAFKKISDAKSGKTRVRVLSAAPISRITEAFGPDTLVETKTDATIGQGVQIHLGDTLIDNTLRSRLETLRSRITQ